MNPNLNLCHDHLKRTVTFPLSHLCLFLCPRRGLSVVPLISIRFLWCLCWSSLWCLCHTCSGIPLIFFMSTVVYVYRSRTTITSSSSTGREWMIQSGFMPGSVQPITGLLMEQNVHRLVMRPLNHTLDCSQTIRLRPPSWCAIRSVQLDPIRRGSRVMIRGAIWLVLAEAILAVSPERRWCIGHYSSVTARHLTQLVDVLQRVKLCSKISWSLIWTNLDSKIFNHYQNGNKT